MSTVSVFVISDHLMFAHGLESLISRDLQLELIGQEKNIDKAIILVKSLQPDVVIIDSSSSKEENYVHLNRLLQARPALKVIDLSLNDNNLHIYHSTQKMVESLDDLKSALIH